MIRSGRWEGAPRHRDPSRRTRASAPQGGPVRRRRVSRAAAAGDRLRGDHLAAHEPHRARARRARARRRGPQARRAGAGRARSGERRVSELLALGASHKTAPVEVREKLALPDQRAAEFLRDLRGNADVQEAVAISTCNRTELYLVVGDPVEAEGRVLSMLSSQAGIRPTELASAIYSYRNCDAARHLYRVTAGLESMIVGEAEVQGQGKRAYDAALARETGGPPTHHLL